MKHLALLMLCLVCVAVHSHNPVFQGLEYKCNSENKTASLVLCKLPGIHNWDIDSMSLDNVVVPKAIEFRGESYTVTSVGDYAFADCPGLVSVQLPASLNSIGRYAFQGCVNLGGIVIPKSVATIGEGCFMACVNLRDVKLPATLRTLSANTFAYCSILNNITLPAGLTEIGKSAFTACHSLDNVNFSKNLKVIGSSAFSETGFRYVTLPSGVMAIGGKAFSKCHNLTAIVLSSSLQDFGDSVFFDSPNLSRVYVLGCRKFGSADDGQMFYEVKPGSYRTLLFFDREADVCVVPDSFNIAAGVFSGNVNLKKVKLPGNLKSIGNFAFAGCSSLSEVVLPEKIEYIGEGAFVGCDSLKSFNVFRKERYFTSDNGKMLFHRTDGGVVLVAYTGNDTSVTIPSYVTELGYGVFHSHAEIREIVIPTSVNAIGAMAFYGCKNLGEIALPEGISVIPDQVFDGCESLGQILLPSTVTKIGNRVFCNCRNLALLRFPANLKQAGHSLFAGQLSERLMIVSLSANPPTMRSNSFVGIGNAELHVPAGSAGKYRNSVSWGKFRNIIDDL